MGSLARVCDRDEKAFGFGLRFIRFGVELKVRGDGRGEGGFWIVVRLSLSRTGEEGGVESEKKESRDEEGSLTDGDACGVKAGDAIGEQGSESSHR